MAGGTVAFRRLSQTAVATLQGYEQNIEWNIHRWCGYWGMQHLGKGRERLHDDAARQRGLDLAQREALPVGHQLAQPIDIRLEQGTPVAADLRRRGAAFVVPCWLPRTSVKEMVRCTIRLDFYCALHHSHKVSRDDLVR